MKRARLMVRVVAVLCLVAGSAAAQTARLEVRSNAPDAVVYLDGEWLGRKADGPFQIPVSSRIVRVAAGDDALWSVDPLFFPITPTADTTIVLHAHFPRVYQFDSTPSGAEIVASGVVLGRTPLRLEQREALDSVRVQLDGFAPLSRTMGDGLWNREVFELESVSGGQAVSSGFVVERKRRDWVSIAATTSALAAGALAIHFRTKADNRFDDYNREGKLDLKSDIKRLDLQSGVALGAMQLGLGVVVVRLAF